MKKGMQVPVVWKMYILLAVHLRFKSARCFSIILDGKPDEDTIEQMTRMVWFVAVNEKAHCNIWIKELLLECNALTCASGASRSEVLLPEWEELGSDITGDRDVINGWVWQENNEFKFECTTWTPGMFPCRAVHICLSYRGTEWCGFVLFWGSGVNVFLSMHEHFWCFWKNTWKVVSWWSHVMTIERMLWKLRGINRGCTLRLRCQN